LTSAFVSYAQNAEDVMLRRALGGIGQGFYIDVGAADPREDSVTYAFYQAGWRGINIEPAPGAFARLLAWRPRDINLNIAAGAADGASQFFLVDGGNGLSTTRPKVRDSHAAWGAATADMTVPVRSLRRIVAEHVTGPVHFLKIDVEGSERDVLAGTDFSSFRPWIVLVEATVPNTQQPNHAEWETLLLTAGYVFVWFDGLNRFYVAAERPELRDAFRLPPNIFDGFVRAAEVQARLAADTLRAALAGTLPPVFLHGVGHAGGRWLSERFRAAALGYAVCDADGPGGADEVGRLIVAARGRPVLRGGGLFARAGTLLAAHGGVHLYLRRQPRGQFCAGQDGDAAAALALLDAADAPPVLQDLRAGLGLPAQAGLDAAHRYALFFALWLYGWLEARPSCQAEIEIDRLADVAYQETLQARLAALGVNGLDLSGAPPRSHHTMADDAWFETQERRVCSLFTAAGYEAAPLAEARRASTVPARAGPVPAPASAPARRLFVDVTITLRYGLNTGIQRVVRAATTAMLNAPAPGWRVAPVYLSAAGGRWHYRAVPGDDEVTARSGDVFLGLDLVEPMATQAEQAGLFASYRRAGAKIYFVVHDLLPVTLPDCFRPDVAPIHADWLRMTAKADGAFCISRAVADELAAWYRAQGIATAPGFRIEAFRLGADIENSVPTTGMPDEAGTLLALVARMPAFLMAGTLEPRKGHAQALAAFEALWRDGAEVMLVIVGRQGWMVDELADRLRAHPQRGEKLLWLETASDELLECLYRGAICLLAASRGEGFGLPLIEAARHGLPIIARDLAVFREVAGQHAYYFAGETPAALADAIRSWLALHEAGAHPKSDALEVSTWRDCAARLMELATAPVEERQAVLF
jgi:FkbM family methyltransferase